MFKKLLLILVCMFFTVGFCSAKEVSVKVEANTKISTSDVNLREGDSINLLVANDVFVNSKLYLKKGQSVAGVVTSLVDNGFTCQEASIYAENFRVKNEDGSVVKLNGIVFKKGRNHWMLTQFIPVGYVFIRGGEAKILPQKDVFTLYLEGVEDDL